MDKINCNVIGDLLPLYADDVVSEDTKGLVEGHLAECEECAEKYAQMKREIDEDIRVKAAEVEKQGMINAKKHIRKKRLITAMLSVIAGAIIISIIISGVNMVKIPVEYEKDRFEVVVREEGGEDCLFLRYKGKMSGHEMVAVSDAGSGEETLYIELYTTPWWELFGDEEQRGEIFCGGLNFGDDKVIELRLIEGDIRQFYEPTRNYETLADSSVLLWKAEDEVRHEKEAFIAQE